MTRDLPTDELDDVIGGRAQKTPAELKAAADCELQAYRASALSWKRWVPFASTDDVFRQTWNQCMASRSP